MKARRERILPRASTDSGLSLIEVIVAVIILTTVALSSAALGIQGISTSTAQQRSQVAVTIANSYLETVSGTSVAVNTSTTPSVSGLYTRRYSNSVATAFTAQAGKPGVSSTYQGYDPASSVTSSSVPVLPIVVTPAPSTTNGTQYTVTTLIGPCYEAISGGNCAKLAAYPTTPPASTPAGYADLIRVIVIVSWTAGTSCSASGCYYEATTLVDPHSDLQWVTHG